MAAKVRFPSMQAMLDFIVLWMIMVLIIKFVPVPMQLKRFIVPTSSA